MRSDQQQAINRLAGTSATAFLCAVLCVYPLYIDKFSNLGVTKFTGCFTLFLLFLLWLVACTAIGARAPRPRNANAGRDVTLWSVLAFAGTSLISTFTSLAHGVHLGAGGLLRRADAGAVYRRRVLGCAQLPGP